jgi:hypothetical protein
VARTFELIKFGASKQCFNKAYRVINICIEIVETNLSPRLNVEILFKETSRLMTY